MKFGVNDTPEYQAMNPTGLIPTIDDDGFVLWESNVIVRYLAAKHAPGTLYPGGPRGTLPAPSDGWTGRPPPFRAGDDAGLRRPHPQRA